MRRVWTQEEIRSLLETSDRMVERSVKVLFDRQTAEEKVADTASEQNGVGFNKFDSEILSSFARSYVEYGRLSKKQIAVARKRVLKYARQLTMIANGEV